MDELLLSKIRLGIVAELINAEWMPFPTLVANLGSTNGNVGAHLAKLVDAGYVDEEKIFVDRKPQSRYSLTEAGRNAFAAHVRSLELILSSAKDR